MTTHCEDFATTMWPLWLVVLQWSWCYQYSSSIPILCQSKSCLTSSVYNWSPPSGVHVAATTMNSNYWSHNNTKNMELIWRHNKFFFEDVKHLSHINSLKTDLDEKKTTLFCVIITPPPPTAPPLATTKGQLHLRETSQYFKMLTCANVLMKAAIWTRRCCCCKAASAGKNYRRSPSFDWGSPNYRPLQHPPLPLPPPKTNSFIRKAENFFAGKYKSVNN